MIRFSSAWALVLGCSTFACASESTAVTGQDDDLIGGRLAKTSEYPATLLVRGNCTVSKVGPRHLLTAAHCVDYYGPGSEIEITAKNAIGAFVKGSAEAPFTKLTVAEVVVEPTWAAFCQASQCGSVDVSGRTKMADAAVLVVTEEIAGIAEAAIDLSPVENDDAVVIAGYGCEDAVGGNWDYQNQRLRIAETRAVAFDDTIHTGSFMLPEDRRSGVADTMAGIYLITPGPDYGKRTPIAEPGRDAGAVAASGRGPRAGGLCPGDSGGPLYRKDGTGLTVVGINANYTFSGGESYEVDGRRFNYGGNPTTNWHTRVDGTHELAVGAWLKSIGVRTVCSRGGC